ncbi:hypothetical protein SAMN05421869_1234 [Nonomuraea jiangxiensis]|uniref:Uncharacterized protein n=1 Tax=Nonomuraea jiangxiensis TaxID=633440 RepID=A0A1G9HW70_9ACTN|nr:hypothetical protein SAMN05421869_1234 [Nonomuraea jiangxiensis]
MVGDYLRDRSDVARTVDFDHADAELVGGADGVLCDEAIAGEAVGLCSSRIADAVPERGGSG